MTTLYRIRCNPDGMSRFRKGFLKLNGEVYRTSDLQEAERLAREKGQLMAYCPYLPPDFFCQVVAVRPCND